MNIQPLTPSPFERLRQLKNGQEYWSARDLQYLLGYKNWREFEDAIERAMIACKNVGQNPEDHFGDAPKLIKAGKGATREVTDYQLTRYACYLTAMNGDPRKSEIAQAQTYFAIKTYQAETLQPAQRAPLHALTDALRERALLNLKAVAEGYFSVMGELFKHLYNLEAILNRNLDEKATIEISVGLRWSRYARDVLHIPDADRRTYEHHYQDGRRDCNAWAYPILYLTTFDQWLWFTYIPNEFPSYVKYRAIFLKQCEVKQMAAPKKQQSQQIKAPHQLTLL